MMSNRTALFLMSLFLSLPQTGLADNGISETEYQFRDYTVHYNVIPSMSLDPHIAKVVGIKRAPYRSVLTIAVKKHDQAQALNSSKAEISGKAYNLIGQIRYIKLREIKDGNAIYYVGDFTALDHEKLKFEISVRPEGEHASQELEFERNF